MSTIAWTGFKDAKDEHDQEIDELMQEREFLLSGAQSKEEYMAMRQRTLNKESIQRQKKFNEDYADHDPPEYSFALERLPPHLVFAIMPFLWDVERQNLLHAAVLGPVFIPRMPVHRHGNHNHGPHGPNCKCGQHGPAPPPANQQQPQQRVVVQLTPQQQAHLQSLPTQQQKQTFLQRLHQEQLRIQRNRDRLRQGMLPVGENGTMQAPFRTTEVVDTQELIKEAMLQGPSKMASLEGQEDEVDKMKTVEEEQDEKEEKKPSQEQRQPHPDVLPDYQMTNPTRKMRQHMSTSVFNPDRHQNQEEEKKDGTEDGGTPATEEKGTAASPPAQKTPTLLPGEPANPWPDRPRINLNPAMSIIDPHTLLERLNTRRLFRRVNSKTFPGLKYNYGRTTDQLAEDEWEDYLCCAREKYEFPTPPKLELLLFSAINQPVAVLASYPRSGNSLMRTLYERTTLRVTGSDMRGGLTKHDLVGEAAVDNGRVQFVKTHFPERRGHPPFEASRVVLLVRNPYDALDSYFNLMMTSTHTTSITDEEREKMKQVFAEMALKEIQVWKDFHEYWLAQDLPTIIVRYEDLTRFPDKVMSRVLKHCLEVNSMHFFHRRIEHCFAEEKIEKLGSYKPRSGGIGKALKKYAPELLQKMNMGIVDTMEKLGYESFLVPDASSWDLTPLPNYAIDLNKNPGRSVVNHPKIPVVRTNALQTNWQQVKKQLGVQEPQKGGMCDCWRCRERGMN